jgi:hypothetical protein
LISMQRTTQALALGMFCYAAVALARPSCESPEAFADVDELLVWKHSQYQVFEYVNAKESVSEEVKGLVCRATAVLTTGRRVPVLYHYFPDTAGNIGTPRSLYVEVDGQGIGTVMVDFMPSPEVRHARKARLQHERERRPQ